MREEYFMEISVVLSHANTGMLLLNLQLMREKNMWGQLVEAKLKFQNMHPECGFWPPDQAVWNAWFTVP